MVDWTGDYPLVRLLTKDINAVEGPWTGMYNLNGSVMAEVGVATYRVPSFMIATFEYIELRIETRDVRGVVTSIPDARLTVGAEMATQSQFTASRPVFGQPYYVNLSNFVGCEGTGCDVLAP